VDKRRELGQEAVDASGNQGARRGVRHNVGARDALGRRGCIMRLIAFQRVRAR